MPSSTETIARALRVLAATINAPDDVPRLAQQEAAERLEELERCCKEVGDANERLGARVIAAEKHSTGLTAEVERLRAALERISRWHGEFPETGKHWPNGTPTSYQVEHGSNGERDFMRGIARAALADTAQAPITAAARDVLAERARQISAEGWTPEHDDQYDDGELIGAAFCYSAQAAGFWPHKDRAPAFWPWDKSWWKPTTPRRDLVKAGALIQAAIERIDRADGKEAQS